MTTFNSIGLKTAAFITIVGFILWLATVQGVMLFDVIEVNMAGKIIAIVGIILAVVQIVMFYTGNKTRSTVVNHDPNYGTTYTNQENQY